MSLFSVKHPTNRDKARSPTKLSAHTQDTSISLYYSMIRQVRKSNAVIYGCGCSLREGRRLNCLLK